MSNRVNPYQRLQGVALKWALKVVNPKRRNMFRLPTEVVRASSRSVAGSVQDGSWKGLIRKPTVYRAKL